MPNPSTNPLNYASRPPLDDRSRAQWECTRRLGFWYIAIVHGVMAWGMTMTVIMLIIMDWTPLPQPTHAVTKVALMGLVGGFAFGAGLWVLMERKYARTIAMTGDRSIA